MIGHVVTLSEDELAVARFVAERRQQRRETAGVARDQHTAEGKRALDLHVLGCEGEMAFAKWSGRYWSGGGERIDDDTDVGGVEVRTRGESWHELFLFPKDLSKHPRSRYVLVTKESADSFCIRGWVWSHEVPVVGTEKRLTGLPSSFFVAQRALRPCRRAAA